MIVLLLVFFFFFFFWSRPPAVPAPVDLTLDSVEATEVVLSWHAPDSQLTGYRVVFLPKDSDLEGPIKELHLAPDTTNATASGLMVGPAPSHLTPPRLLRLTTPHVYYNGHMS